MSIQERDDVRHVVIMAPIEGDEGFGALVGHDDVTAIKIVRRHGPLDWIPYVEVWKGEHLHVEAAQHQCAWVEFTKP